jgi:amino acid transporter
MIVIVLLLSAIYYVAYRGSAPTPSLKSSRLRTFVASSLLGVFLVLYAFYQSNRPPSVNYWRIGWTEYINYLNAELAKSGSPNRIGYPGQ